MRHRKSGRKLGRTTSHRWALFRNQSLSLVEHERIETTLNKARELRPFADHLVTLGKKGDLHSRRQAFKLVPSDKLLKKLFEELAPRFKDRQGGYSRILKLGYRQGDSAAMALIEYLPGEKKEAKTESKPVKPKKVKTQKKAKQEAELPAA